MTQHVEATAAPERAAAPSQQQTVWTEHVSCIDRIPRWLAMLLLLAGFLAVWQLVYELELISRIILPSPVETAVEKLDRVERIERAPAAPEPAS